KLHDRRCRVIEEAEASGVALLSIPDEVGWSHFNAVLARAFRTGGEALAMPGMASVPAGDLFALANAIAAMVGGAVSIEDPRGRILAYSTLEGQVIDDVRRQGILGRQIIDIPTNREIYSLLWRGEGVIRVEPEDWNVEGFLPRIASPVRAGNETLGSIWVVQGDVPLARDAESTLADVARVAALHMIHARSTRDIDRHVRGDLLRSI